MTGRLGRLEPILQDVRRRLIERRTRLPLAALRRAARAEPTRRRRFMEALRGDRLAIIAECKRRSPASGPLRLGEELSERAAAYARGGAAAVSVLTEQDHFLGN